MTTTNDGREDFDFFIGSWQVQNRRLRERLVGCTEWEAFGGISAAQQILGGLGNFDSITFNREAGNFEGSTLRLFNPVSQEWSLYWCDNLSGILYPPMIGKFEQGRGLFYAQERHLGRAVFSRFIWSGITPERCHWEQALSPDGGQTWETNWTMDFTRM